jgi:hypothetical protein
VAAIGVFGVNADSDAEGLNRRSLNAEAGKQISDRGSAGQLKREGVWAKRLLENTEG